MSDFYPQGVGICDVNEAITVLRSAGCTGIGGVALSDYASDALGGDAPGFGGDEADTPRLILALAAEVVRQRRGMMEAVGETDALRASAQVGAQLDESLRKFGLLEFICIDGVREDTVVVRGDMVRRVRGRNLCEALGLLLAEEPPRATTVRVVCPACDGARGWPVALPCGEAELEPCQVCRGEGEVEAAPVSVPSVDRRPGGEEG